MGPTVNAQVGALKHGGSRSVAKTVGSLTLLIAVLATLTACGNGIPVDPGGSLDLMRHGDT